MAADANALTLYDYGALSNDPLVKKITMGMYEGGVSVLEFLPLVNTKSLKANGIRWTAGTLPSVGTRMLNDDPDTVKAIPKKFEEQAYIVSNKFQIDRFLAMENNAIQDPIDAQFMAWQESFTRTFSDKFFNATPTADEEWFAGIRYRLDNPSTYGIPSENKIDAGAVDLRMANMTATTAETFFEYLDQTLDYVGSPDGNGVVLFMGDVMSRRISSAAKRAQSGNALDQSKDQYDRKITTYKNARIVQLPRKSDDSTQIITSTETTAGLDGASTYTSIYAVRFGANQLTGWQFEPLQVKDLGIDPTVGTRKNVLVDWAVGIAQIHPRSVARLFDIRLA